MGPDIDCFFYHSCLSSDYDASCVSAIIKTARAFNAEHGITGVLVFDGERFCQYLEGPRMPVNALITRLEVDPRHAQFTPLMRQPLIGPRLYDGWTMAYCMLDGLPFMREILNKTPEDALSYLRQSGHALDMG